jgi:hypothetical protein
VLEIAKIQNSKPIEFNNLEEACNMIKYDYLGVSGVYSLIDIKNKDKFYIGSSVNLARRMEEYNKLTKNLRTPNSSSELEISKIPASN